MRLTAFALLVFSLHVGARGFSQAVTYSGKNVPLETVFSAIEKQTGFVFFYDYRQIEGAKPVTLDVKNEPLKAFLERCFREQPFGFTIEDRTIVITHRGTLAAIAEPAPEYSVDTAAQHTLDGTILGEANQPLVGATVMIRGSRLAVVTDIHGRFQLKSVSSGSVLEISFVGYNKSLYSVGTDQHMLVRMALTTNVLDETVVQAYGTTSQRYATGNIATVNAKDLEKQPVMNPLLALQGLVPGLVVTPASNAYPSGIIKVELRGRNSINPNLPSDPLYVIDGVPIYTLTVDAVANTSYAFGSPGLIQNNLIGPATGQSPLFSLNTADIESISVLKDADATSIYGSRAANGVILITTKKGRPGKSRFDISADRGTSFVARHWDMLNTTQYLQMRHEALANDGITPTAANSADLLTWDTTRYTDWQKYLWGHKGMVTNVQAGLSGGEGHTTFRISAGYHQQNDISMVTGANRLLSSSLSLNNTSLDQKLSTAVSVAYSYADVNGVSIGGGAVYAPDAPSVFDSKGNINFAGWNPYAYQNPGPSQKKPYEGKTSTLLTSMRVNYTIVKGLVAGVNVGYNKSELNQHQVNPIASQNPANNPTGSLTEGINTNQTWLVEPQINYTGLIGKGRLEALVGGSLSQTIQDGASYTGSGLTSDVLLGSVSNATTFNALENYGIQKVSSFFARVNYNWENKYMLTLSGRRDGSSLSAPTNEFGSFGSVGAAWILSEEKWMKKILPAFFSFVKLRGSYGSNGVSNTSPYAYLTQWSANLNYQQNWPYGGVTASTPRIHANPNYHWEVSHTVDLDLSLGFLKDRINLDVDYYQRRCGNQLLPLITPGFTGFNNVIAANLDANVQNSGLELKLSANLVNTKDFRWTADFNMAFNRNKLLSYPGLAQSAYTSTYQVGQPLNVRFLFRYTGVDKQKGVYTFEDHNHDGKVQADYAFAPGTGDDDRYIHMDLSPKYTGGFGTMFSWRGLSLQALFYFKKQMATNAFYGGNTPGSFNNNISTYEYEHTWHKPGDNALYTKYSTGTISANAFFGQSTGAYTDASFVRLHTLALGYNLPKDWARKAGMSNLNVNVKTNNLLTITKYKGLDPETNSFGSMPQPRIITAGISCSF